MTPATNSHGHAEYAWRVAWRETRHRSAGYAGGHPVQYEAAFTVDRDTEADAERFAAGLPDRARRVGESLVGEPLVYSVPRLP